MAGPPPGPGLSPASASIPGPAGAALPLKFSWGEREARERSGCVARPSGASAGQERFAPCRWRRLGFKVEAQRGWVVAEDSVAVPALFAERLSSL